MNETARQARQRRQAEAQERLTEYDGLTTQQKLARAYERGNCRYRNLYETREVKRLLAQLEAETNA